MKILWVERRRFNVLLFIFLLVAGWLLLWSHLAAAAGKKTFGNVKAVVVEVHDGDSIKVWVPLWPAIIGHDIGVRVYGVDTRELKTGATAAKDAARAWLPVGSTVWLRDLRRDKYFRILADVGFDCTSINVPATCKSLAARLIEQNLGVPYFGDTKKEFPTNIK